MTRAQGWALGFLVSVGIWFLIIWAIVWIVGNH